MRDKFVDNQTQLSQLGITQNDIDSRPVIAVGYYPRDLLPPYRDESHQRRAGEILHYAASAPLFLTFSGIVYPNSINARRVFSRCRVVEIVGGNANWCVAESVLGVINRGLFAYVDSTKLFGFNSSSTDHELGRMAMPELGGRNGAQRLMLNENVSLYFRPRRVKQLSK